MLSSAGENLQQEILTDEKFFSRLLSKENPSPSPSFRVYYAVAAGSVPFLWETQPGTPKHTAAAAALPSLAPPPSFYFNSSQKSMIKSSPKSPKRKLIHAILPKLRKARGAEGAPSSTASSSSSSLRAYLWEEEENDEDRMSPTSTLCFGERLALKKALFSIVGH